MMAVFGRQVITKEDHVCFKAMANANTHTCAHKRAKVRGKACNTVRAQSDSRTGRDWKEKEHWELGVTFSSPKTQGEALEEKDQLKWDPLCQQ